MGILNITADSFYNGYLNDSMELILMQVENMITEGARIIDIGGQSTKPGSLSVEANEELDRVMPVIESVHAQFPDVILSVDTFYSQVADLALSNGVSIVNDISAGSLDDSMLSTVAKWQVPYICMHMQGNPTNMQIQPTYKNVVHELLDFFVKKINECQNAGIKDIIIDPGFGFGKTIQHNFQILHDLSIFGELDVPILAGLSRKGMIYKTLNANAADALNGTSVANTIALMNGAHILRVHDVKAAMECIQLFNAYKKAASV
jgi:dihydropteroate synthase